MLIGYMRVSKAYGSQTLDLQRDALLAAGVESGHLYEDQASGKRDKRPGLEVCLKALRQDDTLVASSVPCRALRRSWPREAARVGRPARRHARERLW